MAEIQQLIDDVPFDLGDEGLSYITFLTQIADEVPNWWSTARDKYLRDLWINHDPLKVAVSTFIEKVQSIPLSVHPHNTLIDTHVQQAQEYEHILHVQSGIYSGLDTVLEKVIQDYLIQDNGGHLLIMGGGTSSQSVLGRPSGLYHLDSARCQRTADPTFPIVYNHSDGERYKLHYTRVISLSRMSSPNADMNGVGISAVSSALDSARELRAMTVYAQEKMGSRPQRQVLYAKTGATYEQIAAAVRASDNRMDSEGFQHFSKTLVLAPKSPTGQLDLGRLDLTSTPDGFDREKVSMMDLAILAAAFGLDLRDLSINFGLSGQTRADAEVQERKGRGKGPGTFIEKLQRQLDQKFLPPHLFSSFDNQDDDQDEQQANIWNVRSQARERDLTSGAVTVRASRQRMLRLGEITDEEFEYMELLDGRLSNGLDVYALWSDLNEVTAQLLDVGVENPYTDVPDFDALDGKIMDCEKLIMRTSSPALSALARQSLAALNKLKTAHSMAAEDGGFAEDDMLGLEQEIMAEQSVEMQQGELIPEEPVEEVES